MLKVGDWIIVAPLSDRDVVGNAYAGCYAQVRKVTKSDLSLEVYLPDGETTRIGGRPEFYKDVAPVAAPAKK